MEVLSRKRGRDITILVLSVIWNKYYSYTVSFSQVLAPTPHIEPWNSSRAPNIALRRPDVIWANSPAKVSPIWLIVFAMFCFHHSFEE